MLTKWSLMQGFVTKARFSKEGEGSEPLHVHPEPTPQQHRKLHGYCPAGPPPHHPHLCSQLRREVYSGSCRSAHPACIPSQASIPTPPASHATWPPSLPEKPGRAAASRHTQGSHMLAWPPGTQARVLPWHGAHSRAQLGQRTAWQMAAGWGPGEE